MQPFPYFEIVKKAYELTVKNPWLWVFGLFIGGTLGLNLGSFNYAMPRRLPGEYSQLRGDYQTAYSWITSHLQEFAAFALLVLAAAFVLIVLSGLSRAAVIWGSLKLVDEDKEAKINFKTSVREGGKFLWPVVGLQICITAAFFMLLGVFLGPVLYLFLQGAVGRAAVLVLLALVILFPSSVVFIFLHRYGPIFIVLYRQRIAAALQLSFSLLRQKLRESLLLAAFLIGTSILFILGLTFLLTLLGLPIGLLALLLLKLELFTAFYVFLLGAVAIGIVLSIVLSAGFAVYQNIAWVLAVRELVKTQKFPAKAKEALAAEPVS